jgi:hypothetical protein
MRTKNKKCQNVKKKIHYVVLKKKNILYVVVNSLAELDLSEVQNANQCSSRTVFFE